ncbi:hypothetical protein [Microbacterium abyssi]|uniref:hypothetical protein n=1 Tax=Microbacterium abyssi TaxID=2782166 RepID=UPI001887F762|nr:hypothetical protein [Microbacterium sp. A18JL241]
MHVWTVGTTASAYRVFDGSGITLVLACAAITGTLRSPRGNILSGPLRIAEITNEDDFVDLTVDLDRGSFVFFHNLAGYLGTH